MTSIAHIISCPNCGHAVKDKGCSAVVWINEIVVLCKTEDRVVRFKEIE